VAREPGHPCPGIYGGAKTRSQTRLFQNPATTVCTAPAAPAHNFNFNFQNTEPTVCIAPSAPAHNATYKNKCVCVCVYVCVPGQNGRERPTCFVTRSNPGEEEEEKKEKEEEEEEEDEEDEEEEERRRRIHCLYSILSMEGPCFVLNECYTRPLSLNATYPLTECIQHSAECYIRSLSLN
jgi:hypothetical protein